MKRIFISGFLTVCALSGCGQESAPAGTGSGGGGSNIDGSGCGGSDGGDLATGGIDGGAPDAGGDGGPADRAGETAGDVGGVPAHDPMLLSETGLYADITRGTLAPGVFPFQPQYALWSDGSTKQRWIALPPNTKIDTFEMDFWDYPAGTRLWKEFTRDGVRVETRLLLKRSPGVWFAMAYKWNAQQTEAVAVPTGEANASGTQHDIPSKENCSQCHSAMWDFVLGFSALQLSHDLGGGLNLDQVKAMNWLTEPPTAPITLPGDAVDKAALGYLHSNCGMCHNERSKPYGINIDIDLWAHTNLLTSVETTRAYLSTVCETWTKSNVITTCPTGRATGTPNRGTSSRVAKRLTPRSTALSSVHELMSLRGDATSMRQMPPVGTELIDPTGIKALTDWINKLPAAPTP